MSHRIPLPPNPVATGGSSRDQTWNRMMSKTPGAITGGLGLAATLRGITALEAIENE